MSLRSGYPILVVCGAVLASFSNRSLAQDMPVVSTDGTLANPSAPPQVDAPAPSQPVIYVDKDGKPQRLDSAVKEEDAGFFFSDEPISSPDDGLFGAATNGAVSGTHVVRAGDTLWGISQNYFNNPWEWPRVWSYNPSITNPHWIYPGDIVRLSKDAPKASSLNAEVDPNAPPTDTSKPPASVARDIPQSKATPTWFMLRQLAYVDVDHLKYSGRVDGSTDEKLLLSLGDNIYISYEENRVPKVGKVFSIYREQESVMDAAGDKKIGAFVRVVGEAKLVAVKKGKRARAVVTNVADVVERGQRVGPLQVQFKNVQPVAATANVTATVVAQLSYDELVGAHQVVILDKGSQHGLRAGNRLFVVRRGDAYVPIGGRRSNTGQNDRSYPARAIGEIRVVQAGKTTSIAVVTYGSQEIEAKDRAIMRKAR